MLTQRMSETLSIVGAGRVGRALGRQLRGLGWRIGAVTARSMARARTAVRVIGGGYPMHQLTGRVLDAKVILITTSDRVIVSVGKKFA